MKNTKTLPVLMWKKQENACQLNKEPNIEFHGKHWYFGKKTR